MTGERQRQRERGGGTTFPLCSTTSPPHIQNLIHYSTLGNEHLILQGILQQYVPIIECIALDL